MDVRRDFDYIFEVFIIPRWALLATETGDAALVLSEMYNRHQHLVVAGQSPWISLREIRNLPLSQYRGCEAMKELDLLGFIKSVSNDGQYKLDIERILTCIEGRR